MNVYGIGRFVADPEVRYNQAGTAFCNATLAWNKRIGDEDKANFVSHVFAGKNAENVAKFFSKGSQIFIKNGELQQRNWEDDNGQKHYVVEVFVKEWSFAGSNNKNNSNNGSNLDIPPEDDFSDDEIPF